MVVPDVPRPAPDEPATPLLDKPKAFARFQAVAALLAAGILLASFGAGLLLSPPVGLVVLGALLIAAAVAAYRTLEDE